MLLSNTALLVVLLAQIAVAFASPVDLAPTTTPNVIPSDDAEPFSPRPYTNRILLIRHGEKPRKKGVGLSRAGKKRAQCLRKFMGRKSKHSVGLIMAEAYNPKSGARARPFLTVEPLAKDLGLKVDVSCERDDPVCVRRVVDKYALTSDKDVVICWKHSNIPMVARGLGARTKMAYPDDRFDIMWVLKKQKIVQKMSENCPGIDSVRRPKYDPDLEIEDDDHDEDDGKDEQEEKEEPNEEEEDIDSDVRRILAGLYQDDGGEAEPTVLDWSRSGQIALGSV